MVNKEVARARADAKKAAQAIVDEIRKLRAGHYEGVDDCDFILRLELLHSLLRDHDDLIDLLKEMPGPADLKLSNALLDWRDGAESYKQWRASLPPWPPLWPPSAK